jgi:hypothetical protein
LVVGLAELRLDGSAAYRCINDASITNNLSFPEVSSVVFGVRTRINILSEGAIGNYRALTGMAVAKIDAIDSPPTPGAITD